MLTDTYIKALVISMCQVRDRYAKCGHRTTYEVVQPCRLLLIWEAGFVTKSEWNDPGHEYFSYTSQRAGCQVEDLPARYSEKECIKCRMDRLCSRVK